MFRRRLMLYGYRSGRDPKRSWQRGHQFPACELGELVLVVADLMDVNVCKARLRVLLDLFEIGLRIRPMRRRLGHILLVDHLRGLLEVGRRREVLAEWPLEREVRPELRRALEPLLGVLVVRAMHHP